MLLTVTSVIQVADENDVLAGSYLDAPAAGDAIESAAFVIRGWVVGRKATARHIEVRAGERLLVKVPVADSRPDVARQLPEVPWADRSGFAATVSLNSVTSCAAVSVDVVLTDGTRAAIATIACRAGWARASHAAAHNVVSVVIPCFNHSRFLDEAIVSALDQRLSAGIEVVVVDDGSTDNTVEVARRYAPVRYMYQPNRGLSAARNTGMRISNGEFLVFLDADDRLRPDALATNLSVLDSHPACAFSYGSFRHIGIDGRELQTTTDEQPAIGGSFETLLRGNHIAMHATVMYRRAALDAIGGFCETLEACEDYDVYLRIARRYAIVGHSHAVADYRLHAASMSRNHVRMLRSALQVLRTQRDIARSDHRLMAAYRNGVNAWQRYYGSRIRRALRNGDLSAFGGSWIPAVSALAWYAPREFLQAVTEGVAHIASRGR